MAVFLFLDSRSSRLTFSLRSVHTKLHPSGKTLFIIYLFIYFISIIFSTCLRMAGKVCQICACNMTVYANDGSSTRRVFASRVTNSHLVPIQVLFSPGQRLRPHPQFALMTFDLVHPVKPIPGPSCGDRIHNKSYIIPMCPSSMFRVLFFMSQSPCCSKPPHRFQRPGFAIQ